jgi:hypothetical protein
MNLKQKMVILVMDMALLIELFLAIYLGSRDPETMTVFFLKTYIPAVVLTIITARICIRSFAKESA